MTGVSFTMVPVAVGLLMCASLYAPQPDPEIAWGMGYTAFVHRFCPGWVVDNDVLARAGVLPQLETWDRDWGQGGAVSTPFHAGGSAAEADFASHTGFCSSEPWSWQPDHATTIRRLLHREAST